MRVLKDLRTDTSRPHRSGHLASRKARTREQILKNAIAFFLMHGVRGSRSVSIAAASDVSPGTLFNYFPTRAALASAWVRGELASVLESAVVGSDQHGIRAALRRACRELARVTAQEPAIRLEAWRLAGRSALADERGAESRLAAKIALEQTGGRLRSDIGSSEMARLLIDSMEGALVSLLEELAEGVGKSDPDAWSFRLRVRIDLVLDGARKRNERVSAPAPASAAATGKPNEDAEGALVRGADRTSGPVG